MKSSLDEVREAVLLLHVVDISNPNVEEHIESVNQTLADSKSASKTTIMVFNKIDAYEEEKIESDDLVTERTSAQNSLEDWRQTWMNKMGNNVLFISALHKENFEDLKRKVYEAVREIHVTRFPYNNFLYPEYDTYGEEEE